jgi:hypothetical protein
MVPTRPAHAGVDDTVCSLQTLGILGIHAQTMENRRTVARLLSHMLPFLPVPHGKACGCCRAGRGIRWQTRKEVRNQRRQQKSLFACIASLNNALPKYAQLLRYIDRSTPHSSAFSCCRSRSLFNQNLSAAERFIWVTSQKTRFDSEIVD